MPHDETIKHTSEHCKQAKKKKRIHGQTWLGREGDLLGIVQETEISRYEQMIF